MKTDINSINNFLNGRDPMERIVNIECDYNDEKVSVIYKTKEGQKRIKFDDFKPFVWVKNSAAVRMFNGDRNELKTQMMNYGIGVKALRTTFEEHEVSERLENGYKYIFYAKRKMSYQTFLTFFKKAKTPVYGDKKKPVNGEKIISSKEFLAVSPIEQYMISTSRRLFKGYDGYDELKRLQFDLETQRIKSRNTYDRPNWC